MNESEQTNDGKTESCCSISSACQPDEQHSTQDELETMHFTVEEGKIPPYLLTVNPADLGDPDHICCLSFFKGSAMEIWLNP